MNEFAPAAGACLAPAALEPSLHEPATIVRHIAHELRHPLNTIESIAFYLDVVLPRTEGRARRQLAKLRREVQQVNWILADAIHFLGAAPARPELADLSEVVSRNAPEWNSAGCPLVRFELEPDLPLVRVDVEHIEHLLRNVVQFFRRVSTAADEIAVITSERGGEALLEIRSTAFACPPEEMEALFDPLGHGLPGGSGLALASVRRIADAHGASLHTCSDASGGSRLSLAFPPAE